MVTSLLYSLGSDTHLVRELRTLVAELLSSVVLLTSRLKVGLNKIDKLVVLLKTNTWVSDDEDTEFVETLGDLSALGLPDAFSLLEVGLDVNDGHLYKVKRLLSSSVVLHDNDLSVFVVFVCLSQRVCERVKF